jgi:hypothetical protein
MTDAGYEEFINNRRKYTEITVIAKLMTILSSRVGYTLSSLVSQVKMDIRFRRVREGDVILALSTLVDLGYVEVGM